MLYILELFAGQNKYLTFIAQTCRLTGFWDIAYFGSYCKLGSAAYFTVIFARNLKANETHGIDTGFTEVQRWHYMPSIMSLNRCNLAVQISPWNKRSGILTEICKQITNAQKVREAVVWETGIGHVMINYRMTIGSPTWKNFGYSLTFEEN